MGKRRAGAGAGVWAKEKVGRNTKVGKPLQTGSYLDAFVRLLLLLAIATATAIAIDSWYCSVHWADTFEIWHDDPPPPHTHTSRPRHRRVGERVYGVCVCVCASKMGRDERRQRDRVRESGNDKPAGRGWMPPSPPFIPLFTLFRKPLVHLPPLPPSFPSVLPFSSASALTPAAARDGDGMGWGNGDKDRRRQSKITSIILHTTYYSL